MLTCIKYYPGKRVVLFVLMLVLSRLLQAQTDDFQEPPPEDTTVEFRVEPATNRDIYFLDKQWQPGGGGPDSLQVRQVPDSVVKKLQASSDFWYVNYPFKDKQEEVEEENEESGASLADNNFVQALLWLLIIGGFVAFLIIYLSNSNAGLFRKGNRIIPSGDEDRVDLDNIFEINYQKEIDKAVSNGNYRLAIRLQFLQALRNLSDKRIIDYKQDRTNFDYLLQLHPTKYYNDFFRITRNYEYAWYGQFEIEPEKYTIIKNDFENFGHSLNNR